MTSERKRKIAATHFAIRVLGALATYRTTSTSYPGQAGVGEDPFGADILARTPNHLCLMQETRSDPRNWTRKRRKLNRLGGEDLIPPRDWERRMLLAWDYGPDPEDGRRTIHWFRVQELVREDRLDAHPHVEADGGNARPTSNLVWADWKTRQRIDKDTWYTPTTPAEVTPLEVEATP